MDKLKVFRLVNNLLNGDEFTSNSEYNKALLKLIDLFQVKGPVSCGLYFVENSNCALQIAYNNKKKIAAYNLSSAWPDKLYSSNKNYIHFDSKKDDLLYKNTYLFKLAIRKSVFGFILLSMDFVLDKDEIEQYSVLSNLFAYKIKDFELNQVFKMQLKAMQDAVCEKDEAYNIIKKQHKKLQELDKTKNLFLANISHELRTPLNAIIGFSQALDSQIFGSLNEKQSEYIKDIQISSLHLLGMINEILDISKLEANAMKYSPANISAQRTIQEVINILEPLYKNKSISVQFESKYDGEIFADYQKFQQILYNLLSNAIKFTNNGGKIVVKSFISGNNYCLSVIDNGIGIDKKHHNKIFKKFVHLNNVYAKSQSSTGLGLTITKELVKLHNGKITLISEPNKGSEFFMEFKNILV